MFALSYVRRCVAAMMMLLLVAAQSALAMPDFARKYSMTCAACHSAVPRLNQFGEFFAGNNMKLPNWRDTTLSMGDDRLALPAQPPLGIRAQAYAQARTGKTIDPVTGESERASTDFQSPYLVKLLASAPLSDHITFYFYGIFAEKGGNGEVIIEDAWFRHDDVFGSGIGMMLGQFQISDLMFPREIRLPFQDYMAYRMAGITYDRGVLFDRTFGAFDVGLGLTNGNGIEQNFDINSPGYRRADKMFDNNASKTVFGRVGTEIGGVSVGLFGLLGEQANAVGPAGLERGDRDTDKRILGIDLAHDLRGNVHAYAQVLWNAWDDFLVDGENYRWWGGFAGVDYLASDRWVFSMLYNYADANDLGGTDTIYEGIDINSLTFGASYYFMRNLRGVIEVNIDLLDKKAQSGQYFTGHLDREHYVLVGFDAAF
jgi:hypothetical protein